VYTSSPVIVGIGLGIGIGIGIGISVPPCIQPVPSLSIDSNISFGIRFLLLSIHSKTLGLICKCFVKFAT